LQSRKKNYEKENTLKTVIISVFICILLYMVHFTGSQSKKSEQKKKGSKNTKTCTKISSRRETPTLRTNTNATVLRAQSHGEEVSGFWFRGGERGRAGTSTFCVTSFPHLLRMFPAQFPQAKR
jgi:hypothetical protein